MEQVQDRLTLEDIIEYQNNKTYLDFEDTFDNKKFSNKLDYYYYDLKVIKDGNNYDLIDDKLIILYMELIENDLYVYLQLDYDYLEDLKECPELSYEYENFINNDHFKTDNNVIIKVEQKSEFFLEKYKNPFKGEYKINNIYRINQNKTKSAIKI